ncbi:MAG: methyltransferase domain-containing protein [Burkholderiales bacterium]|jgi:predicted methyltransferase|nr:methyltransferase domain-containing protein [Burkholderiales bacterium]
MLLRHDSLRRAAPCREQRLGIGLASLACAALLAILPPGLAAQPAADPAINAPFRDPDPARWRASFETEGREVYDRRHEIVAATGAAPGMVVADVGAGTGLFARLFAAKVGPGGKVIASDIAKPFVDAIVRSAREQGLANLAGVVGTQTDPQLPAEAVDIVFVSDAYHHFEQPQAMLAAIRRALKSGGRLVIVDFERIPGVTSSWILSHVRAGKETVVAEVEAAGFRFAGEKRLMKENYLVVFERP